MKKVYYTIGEVCELLDIKPHTIRYWETEVPQLRSKSKKGTIRRYTQKDVDFLNQIKILIYDKKFTLEGASAEIKKLKLSETNTELTSKTSITQFKDDLLQIKQILLKRNIQEI